MADAEQVKIVVVEMQELELILPLIGAYQRFYEQTPDIDRNRAYFRQFLGGSSDGIIFAALDTGQAGSARAVGFATINYIFSSLVAGRRCFMKDLYVLEQSRGQGIGRRLIERCARHAAETGYGALTWTTRPSNATAIRLYDGFPVAYSDWREYVLPV